MISAAEGLGRELASPAARAIPSCAVLFFCGSAATASRPLAISTPATQKMFRVVCPRPQLRNRAINGPGKSARNRLARGRQTCKYPCREIKTK